MAKHLPSTVWMLRKIDAYPNGLVRTFDTSKLYVSITPFQDDRRSFVLPRSDARLLARRILQCLEETA